MSHHFLQKICFLFEESLDFYFAGLGELVVPQDLMRGDDAILEGGDHHPSSRA
jgi:hypothetical protein